MRRPSKTRGACVRCNGRSSSSGRDTHERTDRPHRRQDPPARRLGERRLRRHRHHAADRRRALCRGRRPALRRARARRRRRQRQRDAGRGAALVAEVTSTDYVGALLERAAERAAAERLARRASRRPTPRRCRSPTAASTSSCRRSASCSRPTSESARRAAARLPPGRADRPRQLDARRLHRPAVQDPRQARAAACRRAVAGAVGHRKRICERSSATARAWRSRRRSSTSATARPTHFIDVFRTWYGPVHKAFASLPAEQGAALERDIAALLEGLNRAGSGSLVVPSEYLEVVATRN